VWEEGRELAGTLIRRRRRRRRRRRGLPSDRYRDRSTIAVTRFGGTTTAESPSLVLVINDIKLLMPLCLSDLS
jgi:hypothetical protein